jgi:dihydroflavonol-4-reductase
MKAQFVQIKRLPMAKTLLITGANGFIAAHATEQALAAGHHVIGTVRNPADPKVGFLRQMAGAERLALVAADLTAADPFAAHADVDAILHMASPYVLNVSDPQRDLVDPAVKGTLAALTAAARNPRVRRVVLTSSMAAITDAPDGRVLTEADWNTQSSLTRNPYYYSKTLAERAAWDFMDREKPGFDLVVINPFLVIGPAHTAAVNASNQVILDQVKGTYPAILALTWGFVDVRDVARAHLMALDPAVPQGRYLCAAETRSMADTVRILREAGAGGRLPRRDLSGAFGTGLMKIAARFQPPGLRSYLLTHLGRVPRFDNARIRGAMGLTFRDVPTAIRDTLADLRRWGHLPAA